MELKLGDKTYVVTKIKARMLRRSIEIGETIDFEKLSSKDVDVLSDFVCETFGNQFTRDEFYDGLDSDKLLDTLFAVNNRIRGGAEDVLATFPEK